MPYHRCICRAPRERPNHKQAAARSATCTDSTAPTQQAAAKHSTPFHTTGTLSEASVTSTMQNWQSQHTMFHCEAYYHLTSPDQEKKRRVLHKPTYLLSSNIWWNTRPKNASGPQHRRRGVKKEIASSQVDVQSRTQNCNGSPAQRKAGNSSSSTT